MKQAYLITAYKDFSQLRELANFFSETSRVLIHVDEKSKSITDEGIRKLNQISGCRAFRGFEIAWGSFAHVEAIVALMILALRDPEVSYLHLLTGEDLPLYSARQLDERFLTDLHIYMDCIGHKDQTESVICRYRYKNRFAGANMKNKLIWSAQKLSERFQEKTGSVRTGIGCFDGYQIKKGLVYCSMPREAAEYVIRFIASEGASFWQGLKSCQVPEEFFFQTIFGNAPVFRDRVVEKQLRFMDWSGDGSSPRYLTGEDYEAVLSARKDGCCFARKFCPQQSGELKEKLFSLIREEAGDSIP